MTGEAFIKTQVLNNNNNKRSKAGWIFNKNPAQFNQLKIMAFMVIPIATSVLKSKLKKRKKKHKNLGTVLSIMNPQDEQAAKLLGELLGSDKKDK